MAGKRQPVELLLLKGKKHLTKKEIAERKATEVKAPADKVRAPAYLPKDLKREFKKIADELVRIEIMTNLDVDALARFLFAKKMYLEVTESLMEICPTEEVEYVKKDQQGNVIEEGLKTVSNASYSDLLINQDKLFKQCRSAASDLGLTISSRVRLIIPKQEEKPPQNEAEKRFGDRV
ncbi:phage terminase small subunit P27 family [Mesobacillus subterraneus]|uniref:phage terminase small subunit P27 family n=1 Tax=Mesobacillus subterraneus TaxID=285983 RepID=UPI00203A97DC|nr:phage terminase small subunit P27 family [Mesobacillus subterraneus]MCM3663459.1 phage terminase small subunit P27 family [Mesobacillus subterraneus]MCM3683229.1 phage terminase small subunit P27 family [Mesobacillus subterraneus]